jgi:hypothetical protein
LDPTNPPTRTSFVDAGLNDCFVAPADIEALVGGKFHIATVTRSFSPYTNGTTESDCSYDDESGASVVLVDVFDPVDGTVADLVHAGEDAALAGVGDTASYNQDSTLTSIYIGAGKHMIVLYVLETKPSEALMAAAGKAAYAAIPPG